MGGLCTFASTMTVLIQEYSVKLTLRVHNQDADTPFCQHSKFFIVSVQRQSRQASTDANLKKCVPHNPQNKSWKELLAPLGVHVSELLLLDTFYAEWAYSWLGEAILSFSCSSVIRKPEIDL